MVAASVTLPEVVLAATVDGALELEPELDEPQPTRAIRAMQTRRTAVLAGYPRRRALLHPIRMTPGQVLGSILRV